MSVYLNTSSFKRVFSYCTPEVRPLYYTILQENWKYPNKARSVPLNGSARAALADHAARQLGCSADAKAVTDAWASLSQEKKRHPLWLSQKGKQLSASAIGRMFAALVNDCAARGLIPADTTPHSLRHSFAHRYLEQNPGDLTGLARILGHENLETTRVYLHLTTDDLALRMEQMSINAYE